ncbi:MAG: hypothetical protein MJY48_01035 [Bacteroidales bacterium]|nr:hypothetical protein [Bacteroidales bacterium]
MGKTEQEFTYLIEKHKSVIYTVCLMFSKDRDEIDDMFQEILIKLWNGYEKFMDSAFKSNVKTILFDKKLSLVASVVAAVVLPIIGFLFSGPFKYMAMLEIFVLALSAVNIVFYRKYNLNKIPFSDVLNATRTMKDYKKSYTRMTVVVWGATIALPAYFCPRIIEAWSTPFKATLVIVFLAIAVTIGLFVEFRYPKKIIESCDSIIKGLEGFNE